MITLANATRTIELKNPEFDDENNYDLQTSFRTSMSGQIRSFKKTNINKFVLFFTEVSRNKAMEVRSFLLESAGSRITYTDFNGTQWLVTVLNETYDIATVGSGPGINTTRKESNNITLELEVA
jgi:hypothetical protein